MKKVFRKRKFKLSIEPIRIKTDDRQYLVDNYKQIAELKKLKYDKNDTHTKNLIRKAINRLRCEANEEYGYLFWHVTISLGPHKEFNYFHYYPTHDDVINLKEILTRRLSGFRREKNTYKNVTKDYHGIHYSMTGHPVPSKQPSKYFEKFGGGSVFTEKNSIINMVNTEGYTQRIYKAKKPYDKSQYVGVELELVCKIDREKLNQRFIENKLAGFVYVKHDGSIKYNPGEFAHEVTLIAKQNQIEDIVNRVCAVLNSPEVGSYVNNSCGLHVHLDMRSGDIAKTYNNFYKCLPILAGMVPQNRVLTDHARRYCALNNNIDWRVNANNRYVAINTASYNSLKTIEIRLHSGSTNAIKINNWIKILMKVGNYNETLAESITSVDTFETVLQLETKLVEYIKKRTEKFSKDKAFDTNQDHLEMAI